MRLRIGSFELTPIHVVVATGAISLVAVLVVVAVMLPRRSADTVEETPPPARYEWATVERLVLPDDFAVVERFERVPYRPRRERWTDRQLDEYWLDPQEIGLEVLDERVEEQMRRLFEEVR
jgi:hypothetical protein